MTVFLPYYAAAIVLLYCELRGMTPRRFGVPQLPAWAWTAGLVLSFAAQLAIVWYSAATAVEPWRGALPIGVAVHEMPHAALVAGAMLALALLQTCALLGLYRSPPARALVAGGMVAMLLLSFLAPAMISPDPYAYVGDALLGLGSYAPPARSFAGGFAAIDHLFAAPMLPAPYGPLWIAVARIVTAPFPTLLGKLLALRGLGIASVLMLLAGLNGLGVPRRILAVVALNPAIALQYVASAHNDLLGIALIAVAAAFVRRNAALASALIAAAGLVKLPFAIFALPLFAGVPSRVARYAYAAVALSCAIATSYVAGGSAYFRGLTVHLPAQGPAYALNLIVALLGFAAIGVAFLGGARVRTAVWLIPMTSSYVAAWYLTYGLPYALARRRMLAYLAIALPLADALIDVKFAQWWTSAIVLPVVVLLSILPARPAAPRSALA